MADSSTGNQDEDTLSGGQNTDKVAESGSTGVSDVSNTAESSTAGDDNKPSMLDAVEAALNRGKEQSSGSGDDKGDQGTDSVAGGVDAPKAAGDELGEISPEELASYHPKTRRRIEQFLGNIKGLKEELSTVAPQAERMVKLDGFIKEQGFSPDNMNTLFSVGSRLVKGGLSNEDMNSMAEMALAVNNDPQRAYALLTPLMQTLAQITGDILPVDLATEVQAGRLTEEHAREISQSRAGKVLNESQTKQAQDAKLAETTRAETERLTALGDSVGTAITNWENSWKTRDPDHAIKHALWQDKMNVYVARLKTKEETLPDAKIVVAKAEQFKKEVEAVLAKIRPNRQSINPTPQGGSSTGSKAKPSSMLEAIGNALDR